jgi:hypothetical protein
LIKQVSLLALTVLSVARLGVAASCAGGTLSGYVSLGSSGCTIGENTLSDFKIFASGTAGASEINPGLVTITPLGGNYNPSLSLSVNQTATAPSLLEVFFTYEISGPGYVGTSAALSGASETVDGAVTGIENYCEGGAFGPDGVDGCPGANGALVTADGFQNSDSDSFSKVPSLNVTDDFTIDGGTAGTASGGTFTNNFTAVPEPAAAALGGLGMLLAAAYRGRSNKETK